MQGFVQIKNTKRQLTNSHKKKISRSLTGIKRSQRTKKLMSNAKLNVKKTIEHRNNISKSLLNRERTQAERDAISLGRIKAFFNDKELINELRDTYKGNPDVERWLNENQKELLLSNNPNILSERKLMNLERSTYCIEAKFPPSAVRNGKRPISLLIDNKLNQEQYCIAKELGLFEERL